MHFPALKNCAKPNLAIQRAIETKPPQWLLENPYFFCENGAEFSWREVAENIGHALHKAGKIKDPDPKTFPDAAYDNLFVRCA